MITLAWATMWHRISTFCGTFLAVLLASTLISAGGLFLATVLTGSAGADRFAAADVVVTAERSVKVKSINGKGKHKTKTEALAGTPRLSRELAGKIAAVPGVGKVVADISVPVEVSAHGGAALRGPNKTPVLAHGWVSAQLTPYELRSGAPPQTGEVVVDAYLAEKVGDTMHVTGKTGVHQLRVAGVAAPKGEEALETQGAVFFNDAQLASIAGDDAPTALAVFAAPGLDAGALADRLDDLVGEATVHTGQDKGQADVSGADGTYIGAISFFGSMAGLTVFAALFVLTSTVALAVRQRLRELALLRTIGATPRQLRRMLAIETAIVAVAAGTLGSLLGALATIPLAERFRDLGVVPGHFDVSINPMVLIGAVLLGVGVTQVATRIAARRATRISPTQALSETATAEGSRGIVRFIFGLVLVFGAVMVLLLTPMKGSPGLGMGFIACFLLIGAAGLLGPVLVRVLGSLVGRLAMMFGAPGWLASRTTRAQTRRVAAVAVPLALMIAVNAAMLLNSSTLTEIAHTHQGGRISAAQLQITGGISPDQVRDIAATPGVDGMAATTDMNMIIDESGKPQDYDGQGLAVSGEPAIDLGVSAGALSQLDTKTVAVSEDLADKRGWRLGDEQTLWTPDGVKFRLEIIAIYERSAGFGDVVLSAALATEHDDRGLASSVLIRAQDPKAVAERLSAQGFTVGTPSVGGGITEANQKAAMQTMVIISLGFTAIAVSNTFAIATAARRREFADLRLAGATGQQLRRMAAAETGIATVIGLVIGATITGVVTGAYSLAQDGQWRGLVDTPLALGLLAGTALVGIVAGVIPARVVIRPTALPQTVDAQ